MRYEYTYTYTRTWERCDLKNHHDISHVLGIWYMRFIDCLKLSVSVYIDASESCNKVVFRIGDSSATRQWNILGGYEMIKNECLK